MHPALAWRHAVDHLANGVGHANAAERDVAAGNALGKLHDVGLDAVVLEPEPLARSSEARDHLVRNQQHVMAIADLADAGEVVRRRHDHAARALHRLGDEGGDRVRALAKNRGFELVGRGHADAHAGIWIDEAVRIGRVDVEEARHARLEHRPERGQAGRAHRRQRQAVIGAMPRDDLGLVGLALRLPVEPGGLDRAFSGLGATAGEEERVDRRVGDLAQALSQGNGRVVGRPGIRRAVGQGGHLIVRGLGQ